MSTDSVRAWSDAVAHEAQLGEGATHEAGLSELIEARLREFLREREEEVMEKIILALPILSKVADLRLHPKYSPLVVAFSPAEIEAAQLVVFGVKLPSPPVEGGRE